MSDAVTATLQDSTTQALEQLNARTVEQQRRLNEARAREHVGAAGWLQSSLLEEIIRVGREQFASTDALRQVVRVTTESLRQLPISAGQESREGQQRALEGIVASGSEQITAAHELEGVIREALAGIVATPLDDLNARRLERVLERVRDQINSLHLMIEAARAQVGTLEQLQELDRVSASYQARLGELHNLSAEEELDLLGSMGEQVVERITDLDAEGGQQLEKLGSIGEATIKQVSETAATRGEQIQALEELQAAAERETERLQQQD